jgi:hypothetical protein
VVGADVFWNRESMGGFFAAAARLLRRPAGGVPSGASSGGDVGGLLLLGMSDDLFLDLANEAVRVAGQHGLGLQRERHSFCKL